MMCVAVVLAVLAAVPQDPAPQDPAKRLEELVKRVEALEKENARLQKEITSLEKFSQEAAETIARLKQIVANGGTKASTPADRTTPPGDGKSPTSQGPVNPVHGKVYSLNPEHGFVIVDLGEPDGVKEGWSFEIVRTLREEGGGTKTELLGKAEFEKYVGTGQNTHSKLKIVEGDIEKMKYGDAVVANRRRDALPPSATSDEKAAAPVAKPGEAKYRIRGTSGDTYFIDAGSKSGLKQSDKVYVFRDKRAIAQLRVDRVEGDYSACKIIEGTKAAEPAQDDEVMLKDPKTSLVGKVKKIMTSGAATGAWIEVGQLQGAKMGMQFEVRRQGRLIGKVTVKTLGPYHAVCDPVAPLVLEDLALDDFVESAQ